MTVVAWQMLVETGVLAFRFLPAPDQVARAVLQVVRSGALAADLLHTTAITVLAAMIALALGGVLGLGFGLLPRLRRNAMASVDVLRTIPAVALMPIALLTFGPSPSTELMLAVWAAQWPVVVSTAAGVRNVPDSALRRGQNAAALADRDHPQDRHTGRRAVLAGRGAARDDHRVARDDHGRDGDGPGGLGGALVQAMQALNVERMWAYAVVCGIVGASANAGLRRLVAAALPGSPGRPVGGRPVNPIRGLLPLAGLLLVWQLAGDETVGDAAAAQ